MNNSSGERRKLVIERSPISRSLTIKPAPEATHVGFTRTIVLLIHGYNTDQPEADHDYKALRRALEELKVEPAVMDTIWDVYWPGYIPKGPDGFWRDKMGENISRLSYPGKTLSTRRLGRKLARHLKRVIAAGGFYPHVILIGHSLGCRLVLETLRNIDTERNRIPGFCLMAAAVPIGMVSAKGRLRGAAEVAEKRYILYSSSDQVLRYAFRAGQGLQEAVGRFGNPREFWNAHDGSNIVNTWLDHGDYFRGRPVLSITSRNATARHVARLLGKSLPWEIPTRPTYVVEWQLPSHKTARPRVPARARF